MDDEQLQFLRPLTKLVKLDIRQSGVTESKTFVKKLKYAIYEGCDVVEFGYRLMNSPMPTCSPFVTDLHSVVGSELVEAIGDANGIRKQTGRIEIKYVI